jgi:hypothetical protein
MWKSLGDANAQSSQSEHSKSVLLGSTDKTGGKRMKSPLKILILTAFLTSCGPKLGDLNSDSEELSSSIEDAVTTISALLDDQQGESYALSQPKSLPQWMNEIVIPKALASSCLRPVHLACEDGRKTSSLVQCTLGHPQVQTNGHIQLAYSQSSCSLEQVGEQVHRTYDLEYMGPYGGRLHISSENQIDYRGQTIGGGSQLVRTEDGFQLTILGRNKTLIRNGRVLRSRSLRTLTPLEITGGLSRAQRRVNRGQLEVIHNLAGFTATYQADNLQWTSSCCHPVAGQLNVEYEGAKQGLALVQFQGCGQAQLQINDEVTDVQLNYCQ